MMCRALLSLALLLLAPMGAVAHRRDVLINDGWSFRFSHSVQKGVERRVDLPHTWNAQDALAGQVDYKRGLGNYKKRLHVADSLRGRRLFLRFEGANSVATLLVNRRFVGEHRGGYGAFAFEITDLVEYGRDNLLEVRVNNGEQLDVMPLVGDFNMYGGLYRDVHLLVTDAVCISPLHLGSPGLRLQQFDVSRQSARVLATVDLLGGLDGEEQAMLTVRIKDGRRVVAEQHKALTLAAGSRSEASVELVVKRPHLWDGRQDPFLYQVEAEVVTTDGRHHDVVSQNLGLRYFSFDPDKGFFLNGKHLPLHGVCRHQDRTEIGNALCPQHHEEDVALMLDMGVNAIRLSHYPHAPYFYDLLDRHGIVAWSEIPFVGPGGYDDTGFVDSPAFRANGRQQLEEMIMQHGNQPSVVCWGLFNELQSNNAPEPYIEELNRLAHSLDPTRPTTAASNTDGRLNHITDLMAWNRYDGWYGSTPATLATWLDRTHAARPELCIAISEYGAGASIYHQQDTLSQPVPNSWWHPENWQLEYHIRNWEIISSRPYVWGSFVWNMFDFGAAHRTEGDRPGVNDKGLVTFDRKVCKDAYYFYRANWNTTSPTLYLAGRRQVERAHPVQTFRAFTSLPEVELFVNGRSHGLARPDALHIVQWDSVPLIPGDNDILVTTPSSPFSSSSPLPPSLSDRYSVRFTPR